MVVGLAVASVFAAALAWRLLASRRSMRAMESIVADLRSDEAKVREAATVRLSALERGRLEVGAGLMALKAAAQSFPAEGGREDGARHLVAAVAADPRNEYAPVVLRHFREYPPDARFWGLRLLANLDDRRVGAAAVLSLLRNDAAACEGLEFSVAIAPMIPAATDGLFPEILAYLSDEHLGMSVAYVTFQGVSEGGLQRDALAPAAEPALALYRLRRQRLLPHQGEVGTRWMWDDDYAGPRNEAALLLDLFGYVPSSDTGLELRRALEDYRDPRLLAFAAASLVRRDEIVPPGLLLKIASFAETRKTLRTLLRKLNRPELFPDRYETQEALAESEMVDWLAFPTELGQPPDEIELMEIVSTGAPGDEYDHYVYRFRMREPHWAAEEGWMAGVAGAFARRDAPTTEASGDTFSSFSAWESRAPREHVAAVGALLGEAWKNEAEKVRRTATP
jgi:hypothetical protein